MASKDAATASPLKSAGSFSEPMERLGALAKWVSAKAEEMAQLDARIDRRIEYLQRSEDSLRALFESLRMEVGAAQDVKNELKHLTVGATVTDAKVPPAPTEEQIAAVETRLTTFAGELEKQLTQKAASFDEKTLEFEQSAEAITLNAIQRLQTLIEKAESLQPANVVEQWRQEADVAPALAEVLADFERRSAAVVESVRRAAVDQIERLSTQAAVTVEPILSRIDRQREQVEMQLRAAVESAEAALLKRAGELARTGDATVDAVEQRLSSRILGARPRTMDALEATERSFHQRLEAMLDAGRLTVASAQEDLSHRITQFRPRMSEMLQGVADDLVEQLARLEEHAFAMTGWLEQRMAGRTDALIARTRTTLSSLPVAASTAASAQPIVLYADEYAVEVVQTRPSVEVEIFVDRKRSERPPQLARVPAFD